MIRVLLQTTIHPIEDDWNIERYSLLRDYLASLEDEGGSPIFAVTARDLYPDTRGQDPVLSTLADSDFDELWLFAADVGDGLSGADCAGISAFRQRGGGILATRDHQDAGSSICTLAGVGAAHYFHSHHLDPDASRNRVDDTETRTISWPNYHSGRNGDYQRVIAADPVHELLRRPNSPGEHIEYFPAHPHEGGIGVPHTETDARVIAQGNSQITGRPFNLIVAFESGLGKDGRPIGRALAHSSFHHFTDYNWDIDRGCPSFVEEEPGDGMKREPRARTDIHDYVRNAALWLSGKRSGHE
jgi:hypothetical protein